MTHEFKTPISTIALACEALNDNDMIKNNTQEEYMPFVKMISEENKRLEILVEGILQSAVINKGEIIFRKESINLTLVIEELINAARFRLNNNGKISFKVQGTSREIEADKMHTTNIIANLIDNAIKYSPNMELIEIELSQLNDTTKLLIKDNGVGVHVNDKEKIFEKFYRAGAEHTRSTKGTGLGLYLCKRIAIFHNAKIMVTPNSPKGSIFTFIFRSS